MKDVPTCSLKQKPIVLSLSATQIFSVWLKSQRKKKKKSQVTLNKSTKLKQRHIKHKTRAATALPHLHVVPWFILTTAGVVAHEEALKVATV